MKIRKLATAVALTFEARKSFDDSGATFTIVIGAPKPRARC